MKKPRLNCTIIAMCCIVQMSELYNVIWPSYFLQINLYLLLGNVDTVAPVRLRLFAVFLCCHWWWIFFFQPWDLSIHRIWRPTTKQTLKYQWPLCVTLKRVRVRHSSLSLHHPIFFPPTSHPPAVLSNRHFLLHLCFCVIRSIFHFQSSFSSSPLSRGERNR